MKSRSFYYRTAGKILKLGNLEKPLYPQSGFTKKDLLRYYRRISPVVLPHLRNRLFTMVRYPNGVGEPFFFQKQCPSHRPSWVKTALFEGIEYCVINDEATLLWIANLASLELHTTLARTENLSRPTSVVFDLDPGEGAGFRECADVGLRLRKALANLGLCSFAKTSGKKGLHLYVPLNSRVAYPETKLFAKKVAQVLERCSPQDVTSKMAKSHRGGRIFIDWNQNTDFKTTAAVYSLRANQVPTASTPLTWKEVEAASRSDGASERLTTLSPEDVLRRIKRRGDLFAPVLSLRQRLPAL